jgi:hypothetical protein
VETPHDIDRLLYSILADARGEGASHDRLTSEDRAFVGKMLDAIDHGSKAVFVVVNPDNSLDYLIANESRTGAIGILARMIQRTARHISERGDRTID